MARFLKATQTNNHRNNFYKMKPRPFFLMNGKIDETENNKTE